MCQMRHGWTITRIGNSCYVVFPCKDRFPLFRVVLEERRGYQPWLAHIAKACPLEKYFFSFSGYNRAPKNLLSLNAADDFLFGFLLTFTMMPTETFKHLFNQKKVTTLYHLLASCAKEKAMLPDVWEIFRREYTDFWKQQTTELRCTFSKTLHWNLQRHNVPHQIYNVLRQYRFLLQKNTAVPQKTSPSFTPVLYYVSSALRGQWTS